MELKSIWEHGGRFDGEEVSSPASLVRGGGVVRCRGVIKEKSPDFRSPEVGICALDSRTRTTTSTRFSHKTTLSARKPTSFWREKRDTVVILVRGFAKMLSRQNKSRTR